MLQPQRINHQKTHAYKVLLKVAASIIITLFAQKIQEEGEEGKSKSDNDEAIKSYKRCLTIIVYIKPVFSLSLLI